MFVQSSILIFIVKAADIVPCLHDHESEDDPSAMDSTGLRSLRCTSAYHCATKASFCAASSAWQVEQVVKRRLWDRARRFLVCWALAYGRKTSGSGSEDRQVLALLYMGCCTSTLQENGDGSPLSQKVKCVRFFPSTTDRLCITHRQD